MIKKMPAVLAALVLSTAACGQDDPPALSGQAPEAAELDAAAEPDAAQEPPGAETDGGSDAETDAEPGSPSPDAPYDPEAELDSTPLPVDDAQVVIGRLPNGLTYYLRSNDSPGGRLELRLVVRAGSVDDPDGAEGAAHYLEHMLFNGTERYPKNELDETLRDLGAEFGPDLNAYTTRDETVYALSVSTEGGAAVDTAFDVMAQWASAATLAEEDVEAERGIVNDEFLLGSASGPGKVGLALEELYAAGTAYEGKDVLGNAETIRSMTAEKLRQFYDAWYRPSNMAVVAVGDLTTADLETLVRRHFGGLEGRGPEPQREPITVEPNREPRIDTLAFSGVGYSRLSLDWAVPVWPRHTAGGQRLRLLETLIRVMLEDRLVQEFAFGRLSQATEPYISPFSSGRSLRFWGTNFGGSDLAAGTTDLLSVMAGAAEFGFTQEEMDRAVESIRVSLDTAVATEQTQQDSEYARGYVGHFLERSYLAGAEQRQQRYTALLEDIALAELDEHWRWLSAWSGPIVVPYGEDFDDIPTLEEMAAAVASVRPREKAAAESAIDSLMAAPDPVAPVSSGPLDLFEGFEAYEWRFENGATVVFVGSDIAEGEVNLRAESLGGYSILEPGGAGRRRMAITAVNSSGVGDVSAGQLSAYLDGSTASAQPWISATTEGISGSASPDDLEDLFALLHLYHAEPRVTAVGLKNALNDAVEELALAETYSSWVVTLAYVAARHPDNPWQVRLATQDDIDAATADSLLELYERRFGGVDDLVVVAAGDTDRETVADLAARYVGTLPSDVPDTYADRRSPHPDGVTRIEVPLADPSGTSVAIHYDSPVEYTPKLAVTLRVLENIMNEQMIVRVREELGNTYDTLSSLSIRRTPTSGVSSEFSSTGDAQFLDQIYDKMIAIIDEMVVNGPSDADFVQAKTVVGANYDLISNFDLIGTVLQRRFSDDADLLTPTRRFQELAKLTASDVQALAEQLYGPGRRIEVFGVPAGQP